MDASDVSKDSHIKRRLQFCSIQGVGECNEDALIVNERARIYGVVDGATSISNPRSADGRTGGYIAAQMLAAACNDAGPDQSLKDLVLEANFALRQRMLSEGIELHRKEMLWSAAFAIFKVGETTIEYVQAGDCMLYARYGSDEVRTISRDQVRPFDRISLQKRTEARELGYTSKEDILEYVKPYIDLNRKKTNTVEGYSIFNGELELEQFLETGIISRAGLQKIYVVTDGLQYPVPEDRTWEDETNARRMIRVIDRNGLTPYALALIEMEQQDEDCVIYVRHKISDDKTGVVLDFTIE